MKKFFKDVIGEIKNPSEDAGKVLDVIRRVIRVALFVSVCFTLVSSIYTTTQTIQMMQVGNMSFKEVLEIRGSLEIAAPYIRDLLSFIIGLILFFMCNKYINKNENISSKFFIYMLLVDALIPLIYRLTVGSNVVFTIQSVTSSILIICIIGNAFVAFKAIKEPKYFSESQIRIRNISVLSYLALLISILPNVYIFIVNFQENLKNLLDYTRHISEYISEIGFMGYVYFVIGINMQIYSPIILLILVSVFVGRYKYLNSINIISNIFFVFCIIIHITYLFIGMSFSSILYIAVFMIATGYQNKYRVFDKLGTRIFKNTLEKIKTGFNNYLSFKE